MSLISIQTLQDALERAASLRDVEDLAIYVEPAEGKISPQCTATFGDSELDNGGLPDSYVFLCVVSEPQTYLRRRCLAGWDEETICDFIAEQALLGCAYSLLTRPTAKMVELVPRGF